MQAHVQVLWVEVVEDIGVEPERGEAEGHEAGEGEVANAVAAQLDEAVALVGNAVAGERGDDALGNDLEHDDGGDHAGNLADGVVAVQEEVRQVDGELNEERSVKGLFPVRERGHMDFSV